MKILITFTFSLLSLICFSQNKHEFINQKAFE